MRNLKTLLRALRMFHVWPASVEVVPRARIVSPQPSSFEPFFSSVALWLTSLKTLELKRSNVLMLEKESKRCWRHWNLSDEEELLNESKKGLRRRDRGIGLSVLYPFALILLS